MATPSQTAVSQPTTTTASVKPDPVSGTGSLVIPQIDMWRGDPAAEQKVKEISQLQQALSQVVADNGQPYLDPNAIKGGGLGSYRSRTEAAVLAFQKEYNLKYKGDASRRRLRESGAADRVTRAALKSELTGCQVTIQAASGATSVETPAAESPAESPRVEKGTPEPAAAATSATQENAGELIDRYEASAKAAGLDVKSKDWRAVYEKASPEIQTDFLKVAEKVHGAVSAYRELKEERDLLGQQIKDAKLDELRKFDASSIGVLNGPIAKAVDDLNDRVSKLDYKIDQATSKLKVALGSLDTTMEAGSDHTKLAAGLAATSTKITNAGEAIYDAVNEVRGMEQEVIPLAVSEINEQKKDIQKTTLEKERDRLKSESEAIDLEAKETRERFYYMENRRHVFYNEILKKVENETVRVAKLETQVEANSSDTAASNALAVARKTLNDYTQFIDSVNSTVDKGLAGRRQAIIQAQAVNEKALEELLGPSSKQ